MSSGSRKEQWVVLGLVLSCSGNRLQCVQYNYTVMKKNMPIVNVRFDSTVAPLLCTLPHYHKGDIPLHRTIDKSFESSFVSPSHWLVRVPSFPRIWSTMIGLNLPRFILLAFLISQHAFAWFASSSTRKASRPAKMAFQNSVPEVREIKVPSYGI